MSEGVTTTSQRPRLLNPGLALVFVSSFFGISSFLLLLSVVPLYATSVGAGVGLIIGVPGVVALPFGVWLAQSSPVRRRRPEWSSPSYRSP
jgi:hypothetical protein